MGDSGICVTLKGGRNGGDEENGKRIKKQDL